MINLIPQHARKQVQVEYWVRVVSVWLLLLALACVAVVFLMVPSLVLIQSQLAVDEGMYEIANAQNSTYKDLEKSVSSANTIATKLVGQDNEILFTKLITTLREAAQDKVVLTSISVGRIENVVGPIQITGDAQSRATLVQFRDALEASPSFDSAELPLSNLAKDKDVPFSITIVVANNETSP